MIALPNWLPLALGLTFLGVSVVRSLVSRVRDGVNPYVIDHGRPVEGFIGAVFLVLMAVLVAYLPAISLYPELQYALGMPVVAEVAGLRWTAAGLMFGAIVWTGWAQFVMGSSWRVGIPEGETLALRRDGPFGLSRNPIFLGMLTFLLGLTLWSPTHVTIAVLLVAYVVIEVQVRLEEQYLHRTHGSEYDAYARQVRRWL